MRGTTEEANPASIGIDSKPVMEVLKIINDQDARVPEAVSEQIRSIAVAVEALADTILRGGRVFFVGAGTSGRLGVIEAAELPPTFGVSPDGFIAVIAGGPEAVFRSVEAAEDVEAAGREALEEHSLTGEDIVVALSASGRTPFVVGALRKAGEVDALTISILCNRGSPIEGLSEIPIVVETGPEVVAGSTRMRAGTAQKLVLNMLTTTAMIRLGRVHDGYMIGVRPTSRKLNNRAIRMVGEIAGVEPEAAEESLVRAEWDPKVAIMMARTGLSPAEAREALDESCGSLRTALKKMGGEK
jgi:N-acetylmuramic acid 6-phosphate etherase